MAKIEVTKAVVWLIREWIAYDSSFPVVAFEDKDDALAWVKDHDEPWTSIDHNDADGSVIYVRGKDAASSGYVVEPLEVRMKYRG